MYSAAHSRHNRGAFAKNYAPKGFTVRVFKGSTFPSAPPTATAKFDLGYHTIPLAEPRQHWYPSKSQSTSRSSGETTKVTRSTDNAPSPGNRGYETNTSGAPPPNFSIYQSVNDTYIYQASSYSKSDVYSNSEYDASTATLSPFASPAVSTDSLTTLKSPMTADTSLPGSRSGITTPTTTSRSSSFVPVHLSGLSQAQSAIRGIFRSQTPQEGHQHTSRSLFPPHAPSTRPSLNSHPTDLRGDPQLRDTAPIRLPVSTTPSASASGDRNDTFYSTSTTPIAVEPSSPTDASSTVSELEHLERDRIARANAEYNASSSVSSSSYYVNRRGTVPVSAPGTSRFGGNSSSGATLPPPQLYQNLPLRNRPEPLRTYASALNGTNSSSSGAAPPPPRPYPNLPLRSGTEQLRTYIPAHYTIDPNRVASASLSTHSTEATTSKGLPGRDVSHESNINLIPIYGDDDGNHRNTIRHLPPRRSSEERPPPSLPLLSIPQIINEGPLTHKRYVPASRTVIPSKPQPAAVSAQHDAPDLSDHNHRQGPRERRPSTSQPRVGGSTLSQGLPRGGGGASLPATSSNLGMHEHSHHQDGKGTYSAEQRHQANTDTYPLARESSGRNGPLASALSNRDYPSNATTVSSSLPLAGSSSISAPHHSGSPTRNVERPSPKQETLKPTPTARSPITSNRDYPPATAEAQQSTNWAPHLQPHDHLQQSSSQSAIFSSDISNPPSSATTPSFPSQLRSSPEQLPSHTSTGIYAQPRSSDKTETPVTSPTSRNSPTSFGPPNDPPAPAAVSSSSHLMSQQRSSSEQNHQRTIPPTIYIPKGQQPNSISTPTSTIQPGQAPLSRSQPAQGLIYEDHVDQAPMQGPNSIIRPPPITRSSSLLHPRTPHTEEPRRRNSDGDRSIPLPLSLAPTVPIEPHRRSSDGDQLVRPNGSAEGRPSVALYRTVRWTENLICPSPVTSSQRRKGWFNRRGDQLWTNDGAYKPPSLGQEYPSDLDGYPDHGEGWMNEEGVHIDMEHRLIPKVPLRSALKQTRA